MRKRGVLIELTSLLDVILIMMFLLLVSATGQVEEAGAAVADAAHTEEQLRAELLLQQQNFEKALAERQDMEAEAQGLRRRVSTLDAVQENSRMITLSIGESAGERAVLVECEGYGDAVVSLGWENRNYALNALKAALSVRADNAKEQIVFFVFQYDRNTIYQADYTLIANAIQAQKNNANIYFAEYDGKAAGPQ